MKNRRSRYIIIPVLALVLAMALTVGCRRAVILNIDFSPVPSPTDTTLSMSDIEEAIITGGAERGWAMGVESPGHIVGTLNIRAHKAVVDITYDHKAYSITYNDSYNLRYNAEKNTIHSNYNGWILFLDKSIQRKLAEKVAAKRGTAQEGSSQQ